MKHLGQETLALLAGGDLGAVSRWAARRHLRACEACGARFEEFAAARRIARELDELPGIAWNRLAAEMKANIRLGLAAGECVALAPEARPVRGFFPVFSLRGLAACASIAALVVAGIWIERPSPGPVQTAQQSGMLLEATADGIELSTGGQRLILMHPGGGEVTFSAGAQGSMRARYVDAEGGSVRINNVYVD
jgi:hypothetical protein